MFTVGQYLTHVSTQLNDQRYNRAFTRWGRDLLLDYMNLGLAELGTYRPEDFAKSISVTLVTGREQSISDINKIISIYSNSDGTPIGAMDDELSNSFALYDTCPPDVPFKDGSPVYRVISAYVKKENPRGFVVEPPVPAGMSPKINVNIDGAVPQFTLSDWDKLHNIPPKYINCLLYFILGKAHELNRESVSSQKLSEDFMRRFYTVLGVNYKQESRYRGGYYLGQRGDGDPQVTR